MEQIGSLSSDLVVKSFNETERNFVFGFAVWRERKVKFAAQAESGVMTEVLLRVIPLIGADAVIAALIEKG